MTQPEPPRPSGGPDSEWEHRPLYDNVIAALYALPDRFTTPLHIEGVPANDLFTMNSALGAAIEKSVVESLNELRGLWDPDDRYADYSFVRQTQRFPDVILRTENPDPLQAPILMGIELKGWFILSKEGEPSFRYKINPNCCTDADLLVVVPWVFDSVISGKPMLLAPIVQEARFAALQRNFHWEWVRLNRSNQAQALRRITPAEHQESYPPKSAKSSDIPISDSGGNFGRVARCGVMDDEVDARLAEQLLGIPADAWRRFIQIFSDGVSPADLEARLQALESAFEAADLSVEQRTRMADILQNLVEHLRR